MPLSPVLFGHAKPAHNSANQNASGWIDLDTGAVQRLIKDPSAGAADRAFAIDVLVNLAANPASEGDEARELFRSLYVNPGEGAAHQQEVRRALADAAISICARSDTSTRARNAKGSVDAYALSPFILAFAASKAPAGSGAIAHTAKTEFQKNGLELDHGEIHPVPTQREFITAAESLKNIRVRRGLTSLAEVSGNTSESFGRDLRDAKARIPASEGVACLMVPLRNGVDANKSRSEWMPVIIEKQGENFHYHVLDTISDPGQAKKARQRLQKLLKAQGVDASRIQFHRPRRKTGWWVPSPKPFIPKDGSAVLALGFVRQLDAALQNQQGRRPPQVEQLINHCVDAASVAGNLACLEELARAELIQRVSQGGGNDAPAHEVNVANGPRLREADVVLHLSQRQKKNEWTDEQVRKFVQDADQSNPTGDAARGRLREAYMGGQAVLCAREAAARCKNVPSLANPFVLMLAASDDNLSAQGRQSINWALSNTLPVQIRPDRKEDLTAPNRFVTQSEMLSAGRALRTVKQSESGALVLNDAKSKPQAAKKWIEQVQASMQDGDVTSMLVNAGNPGSEHWMPLFIVKHGASFHYHVLDTDGDVGEGHRSKYQKDLSNVLGAQIPASGNGAAHIHWHTTDIQTRGAPNACGPLAFDCMLAVDDGLTPRVKSKGSSERVGQLIDSWVKDAEATDAKLLNRVVRAQLMMHAAAKDPSSAKA